MIKKILHVFLWLALILAFEAATGWVRMYSLRIDNFIMFIKYFLLTLLVWHKWRKTFLGYSIVVWFFTLFFTLEFLYQFLVVKDFTTIAFTNMLLGISGYYAAVLWIKFPQRQWIKITVTIIPVLLAALCFFNSNRIMYFYSYLTFNLDRHEFISPDQYRLTDKDGAPFIFKKDQVYVIDFWYSGCAICFRKFPDFNRRYLHNSNEGISYISVNYPVKNDTPGQAFDMIAERQYQFPTYQGPENVGKIFGLHGYPTIVVMRNDTMYYRGQEELLDKFFQSFPH